MSVPEMMPHDVTGLEATVADLRLRLQEAEEALGAIRRGEVDALVVSTAEGERVLTLQGAEHPYRTILEAMSEGACTFTPAGTILYANVRFATMLEKPLEEVVGTHIDLWLDEAGRAALWAMATDAAKRVTEVTLMGSSDAVPTLSSVDDIRLDDLTVHCMVATDISDRLAAERALRASASELEEAQALAHVGSWTYDPATKQPGWSPEMFRIWGIDPKGGAPRHDEHRDHINPGDWDRFDEAVARAVGLGEPYELELRICRPDGTERTIITLCQPQLDTTGDVVRLHGTSQDITEQRRADDALRRSESMRDVAETVAGVGGWRWERGSHSITASPGLHRLFDVEPEKAGGDALAALLARVDANDRAALQTALQAFDETGEAPSAGDFRVVRRDGGERTLHGESRLEHDGSGQPVALVGYFQDVTERRRLETGLATAATEWRQTFDAMRDAVAIVDAQGRVVRCNAATTALVHRGYDEILGHQCYEVFHGTADHYEDCPQRRAFASAQSETTVLQQDDSWWQVSFAPEVGDDGRVVGGVHVVSDVTSLKEAEQKLRTSALREAVIADGVIAALSRSVEVRDPYTAGHERRVSELAVAIARQLGLDGEQTRWVRIAGMLHDVGKVIVPAEILSKPGRLSAMEFELIKSHPQAAYDILEQIAFDFPLAEIVVQHHERLDGSGYPAGLKGEQILREARILAVADVIEAMSSHRPYRAALGMEAALTEIREHAGVAYDADVVTACVRLVEEKSFEFTP